MTNASTADLQAEMLEPDVAATGSWGESYTRRPENVWSIPRLAQITGFVLSLVASPATAVADTWFIERRRRDAATTVWILQEAIGRPITRAEALRIARQVLEQAERERLEIAEFEAARGIQWEDEA